MHRVHRVQAEPFAPYAPSLSWKTPTKARRARRGGVLTGLACRSRPAKRLVEGSKSNVIQTADTDAAHNSSVVTSISIKNDCTKAAVTVSAKHSEANMNDIEKAHDRRSGIPIRTPR